MNVSSIAARFRTLAQEGEELATQRKPGGRSLELPEGPFYRWRTESIIAIRSAMPPNAPELLMFEEEVRGHGARSAEAGAGILRGLASAAENGELFTQVTNRITTSVFVDFLDMASAIAQDDEYFQGGALIAGAVLEDTLRKICDLHEISYSKRDGIDSLSKKLGDANVYKNSAAQKRVDVWRETRNAAMHGHWDGIIRSDVTEMIEGVTKLIDDYLP